MRSFLDAADLALVRSTARGLPGPLGTAVACLQAGGVLQHDPDDPTWSDRDRLFVVGRAAADAVEAAWPGPGRPGESAGREPGAGAAPFGAGMTLGMAIGTAIGSAWDGGIFRVWCLLGSDAADEGVTWDAARTAVAQRCGLVTAVVGGRPETDALLAAAGWALERIDLTDPVAVLGAMDQAAARTDLPTALAGTPG